MDDPIWKGDDTWQASWKAAVRADKTSWDQDGAAADEHVQKSKAQRRGPSAEMEATTPQKQNGFSRTRMSWPTAEARANRSFRDPARTAKVAVAEAVEAVEADQPWIVLYQCTVLFPCVILAKRKDPRGKSKNLDSRVHLPTL